MTEEFKGKKILWIDSDTYAYRAAAVMQENPIVATHKISKRSKEFKNITAFRDWLEKNNMPATAEDDYEFEKNPRLVEPLENGLHSLKLQIEKITSLPWVEDFRLVIGGAGNFRYDRKNTFIEYKANRTEKPIAYADVRQYMIDKYKDRCVVADSEEADDYVCVKAWESYEIARKARDKTKAPYVIAYCDKDVASNSCGYLFNYFKEDAVPYWNSDLDQTRLFAMQLLMGDKQTDNIPGIEKITHSIFDKYELRKVRGCGKATAEGILKTAQTKKELIERVVEAYQHSWGDEWYYRMEENAFFLYLRRKPGEMFTLENFLKSYGVDPKRPGASK